MLVLETDSRWRFVTQPDHAHLAGRMASLWREDGLPEHPRRDDVLFAAREHDNGWREADAAPLWDRSSSRPHDFTTWPVEPRCEIWRRGVTRYADERPYAARLICRHALALHETDRDDPDYADLLAFLEATEEELAERTGVAVEDVVRDYAWIAATDRFSLQVLLGWDRPPTQPFRDREIRLDADAPGTLRLSPSPFAGPTSFQVPVRTIEARDYGGDTALTMALATARFESWTVRVTGP